MVTLKSVFADVNAALLAGEKVREVGGPGAMVRVQVPGKDGQMMELSVLPDNSSKRHVALASAVLGLVAFAITFWATRSWTMSLVALVAGVITGASMAYWLTGEFHRTRMLRKAPDRRGADLKHDTEVMITAVLPDLEAATKVRAAIESSGGGQVSVSG